MKTAAIPLPIPKGLRLEALRSLAMRASLEPVVMGLERGEPLAEPPQYTQLNQCRRSGQSIECWEGFRCPFLLSKLCGPNERISHQNRIRRLVVRRRCQVSRKSTHPWQHIDRGGPAGNASFRARGGTRLLPSHSAPSSGGGFPQEGVRDFAWSDSRSAGLRGCTHRRERFAQRATFLQNG